MKVFAFQRKNEYEKKRVVPEPIIELIWEVPEQKKPSRYRNMFVRWSIYIVPIMIMVAIIFISMFFGIRYIKNAKTENKLVYTICYGRDQIKYYDRSEDLVFMNPWREECVKYNPSEVNGTWYGSCYDSDCRSWYTVADYMENDKKFMDLVWTRYFIR